MLLIVLMCALNNRNYYFNRLMVVSLRGQISKLFYKLFKKIIAVFYILSVIR